MFFSFIEKRTLEDSKTMTEDNAGDKNGRKEEGGERGPTEDESWLSPSGNRFLMLFQSIRGE